MLNIYIDRLLEGVNELTFESNELMSIDFEDIKISNTEPLKLLIEKIGNYISIKGENTVYLNYDCDRCAEEANNPFPVNLEHYFHIGAINDDDIVEIKEEDKTIVFDKYYLESVVLSLPFIKLCKEDCSGVCFGCGKNLNLEECICIKEDDTDSRWDKLKEISKKLK